MRAGAALAALLLSALSLATACATPAPGGYKLGLTSAASQQRFGIDRPLVGRLEAAMQRPNGATVDSRRFSRVFVEAEIAFVMGRSVDRSVRTMSALRDSVATVHPAIELADWRFGPDGTPDAAAIEADAVGAHRFVLGPGTAPGALRVALERARVVSIRDGVPLSAGRGVEAMGGPWQALLWLAQRLHARGTSLEPGDVVLTGALGGVHAFAPEDAAGRYRVEVEGLGAVEVLVR